ncbi:sugar ABC transporter permease [Candidatus Bipolaricaulota bacterium]|nr:sugar ABC transporter permease [Candidatus Bipolaricaulota bacterium]
MPKKRLDPKLRRRLGENVEAYLYLLPVLLILGMFTVFPLFRAFYISLFRWPVVGEREFIGFANYLRLMTRDRDFWEALRNTAYYVAGSVPITLLLATGVAVLLNARLRGRVIARSAFFISYITPVVAVSLVWRWIFHRFYGLLNYGLDWVTDRPPLAWWVSFSPIDWLNEPRFAIPALIIIGVWQFVGFQAIILLAGLQNIDRQYYDAAKVDGANAWHVVRHITVPLLTPQIFFLLIISMIGAFQLFIPVFILFVGGPGPGGAARTIVFYIYETAFYEFRMGLASAASYILFAIIFVLTLIQFRFSRRWVFYGG